ncbi:MAG TPA: hypothetical protein DD856_02950 [Sulfobacillus sp.]|jgi:hypothetical protein|nr:hypothetical protein [Sulfobacillus sp.]
MQDKNTHLLGITIIVNHCHAKRSLEGPHAMAFTRYARVTAGKPCPMGAAVGVGDDPLFSPPRVVLAFSGAIFTQETVLI